MSRLDSPGRKVSLSKVNKAALLQVNPNAPFLLRHLPDAWFAGMVERDGERVPYILPRLKPLPLVGGANGVKSGAGSEDPPDYLLPERKLKGKGGVLLDAPHLVDEYLREHACQGPKSKQKGSFYCTSWDGPKVVAGKFRMDFDELGYNTWLLSLVERGVIAPPEPEIVDDLRGRRSEHIQRLSTQAHIPAMAMKLDAACELHQREQVAAVPDVHEDYLPRGRAPRTAAPVESVTTPPAAAPPAVDRREALITAAGALAQADAKPPRGKLGRAAKVEPAPSPAPPAGPEED